MVIEYANVQVSKHKVLVAIATSYLSFIQKQTNYSDCGLFAIANAMAICNGQKPEEQMYDVTMIRKHLNH